MCHMQERSINANMHGSIFNNLRNCHVNQILVGLFEQILLPKQPAFFEILKQYVE